MIGTQPLPGNEFPESGDYRDFPVLRNQGKDLRIDAIDSRKLVGSSLSNILDLRTLDREVKLGAGITYGKGS